MNRRLLASLVFGCLAPAVALAQARPSAVCGWGDSAFDSRGRDADIVQVCAGVNTTAVRTSDGRVFVNGDNYYSPAHVPDLPPGRSYIDMDVNPGGGAAVVDDGTVVVWGAVWNPFFGPNGIPTFPPPPAPPAGTSYTQVSAGGYHVLAMRSDGQLVAWGDNTYGQCDVPVLQPGQSIVSFEAHSNTNYLFVNDGSVIVTGDTQGGQALPPTLWPGAGYYVDIYEGADHWLGLLSDGQVVAWGDNSTGACDVPALPPGTIYLAIAAGAGHSHAARSDGVIVSWGTLWGLPLPPSPVLPPGAVCIDMACGQHHMVALLSNGKVVTWGFNWFYQGYVPSLEEAQGAGASPLQFVDASTDYAASMAVLSDGSLVAWGNTGLPPTSVTAGRTFTKVRYGVYHHAALTDTGEVIAWGDNSFGKATIPPLPAGVTYTDFACSLQNTVLVRSDGQALVVGSNSQGQANVPPLPPGVDYVACDTHEYKTLLLRSDGEVVSFGQAVGPNPNVVPPLPPGLRYTEIAASNWFNTAIRSDGTAVAFGSFGGRPIPALPWGVYYVEVDGGQDRVVLRRSDGDVEVCGVYNLTADATPPLDPGTSFLQVSAGYMGVSMGRMGAASTYVGIEPGCAGSLPSSRLVPRDTPKIGRTLEVTLFDLPANVAMMVMSFQQLAQPVSLAFLGMPGCDMHIGLEGVALLSGQDQQATWLLPIPDQPQLLGATFYNQALVLDPQAGNAFGAVVSDVARGVVGDR